MLFPCPVTQTSLSNLKLVVGVVEIGWELRHASVIH